MFAADGQETLAKLTADRFGLVLLDIKMPKLDYLPKPFEREQIIEAVRGAFSA